MTDHCDKPWFRNLRGRAGMRPPTVGWDRVEAVLLMVTNGVVLATAILLAAVLLEEFRHPVVRATFTKEREVPQGPIECPTDPFGMEREPEAGEHGPASSGGVTMSIQYAKDEWSGEPISDAVEAPVVRDAMTSGGRGERRFASASVIGLAFRATPDFACLFWL